MPKVCDVSVADPDTYNYLLSRANNHVTMRGGRRSESWWNTCSLSNGNIHPSFTRRTQQFADNTIRIATVLATRLTLNLHVICAGQRDDKQIGQSSPVTRRPLTLVHLKALSDSSARRWQLSTGRNLDDSRKRLPLPAMP